MAFWVLGERMRVFPYGPLVQAHVNPKYPLVVGDGCEVVFEARIEMFLRETSVLLLKRWSALRVTHRLQLFGSRHFRILAFSTNIPFLKLH